LKLETGFKYVFAIMPDEKSDNVLRLTEESKYISLPLYVGCGICKECDSNFIGI
jgi:hypothetical protein